MHAIWINFPTSTQLCCVYDPRIVTDKVQLNPKIPINENLLVDFWRSSRKAVHNEDSDRYVNDPSS